MRIPAYWVKEKRRGCDGSVWKLRGISDASMQEARERLEERCRIREAFARQGVVSDAEVKAFRASLRALDEVQGEEYTVLLLETIVEKLDEDNIITRNRYGVQVLNSTSVCFVDVDDFPLSLGDKLRGFFGQKLSPEQKLLQTLRDLCATDASLGARLYRTHSGWRIMLAGEGLKPDSARMHEICRILHADPLYESLCSRQQCWRARLSPKPYRVGVPGYPRPVDSESVHTTEAQNWLMRYESACSGKAVCRLVDCIGCAISGAAVELHDRLTSALAIDRALV